MHSRIGSLASALALAAALSAPLARAQEAAPAAPAEAPAQPSARDEQPATRGEVKALLEEIRRLKLERGLRDVEYQSYGGTGPAESKVYFAPKGLSLDGYGEVYYQNTLNRHAARGELVPAKSDLHRVVLYSGHRFNPRFVFPAREAAR